MYSSAEVGSLPAPFTSCSFVPRNWGSRWVIAGAADGTLRDKGACGSLNVKLGRFLVIYPFSIAGSSAYNLHIYQISLQERLSMFLLSSWKRRSHKQSFQGLVSNKRTCCV